MNAANPPLVRVIVWLLRRLLPPETAPVVIGDLLEELHEHRRQSRFARQAGSIVLHYLAVAMRRPHHRSRRRKGAGMDSLFMDVRLGGRALRKRPGFAAIVLITLALGIGAATAIFSIVDGILIRPLPYPQSDRLVAASELDGETPMTFAWPNFVDVRERARSFEALACYQLNAFNVLGTGPARRVPGALATSALFHVLGVRMQMGRAFSVDEDRLGAPPVAVVSHRFWREDLAGDPAALGRSLRTSGMTLTIVGVLPESFRFIRPADLFVPLGVTLTADSNLVQRGNHAGLRAIGRLAPGATLAQADDELKRIAADLGRRYPDTNARSSARVLLLRDWILGDVGGTLGLLMGSVGVLLLLACVNVANLFVARGAARRHELAIRSALGGSRARIVRGLLAETALLAAAGALFGVAAADALVGLLVASAPPGIPRIEEVGVNTTSLLFALSIASICAIVFGGLPALQATSGAGSTRMLTRSSTLTVSTPRRTRELLIGVEVALALVLLAACGLMARTMVRLNTVDPGFDPQHLLTARVVLAGESWADEDRLRAYERTILERVRSLPGIENAALTLSLPIEGSNWGSIFIVRDKPVPPRTELPASAFIPVSAGYFETMGIRVMAGRSFDQRDGPASQHVAIVNETFARRLWPGENPIGKFIKQGWPDTPESEAPWREVVGLVPDIKLEGVDQEVPLQAYLPLAQEPSQSLAVVARTSVRPESLARAIEQTIQSADKDVPVTRILPMTDLMSSAIARQRLSTLILATFALVALVLSGVGLYGVVSHSVTERTREIGIRMALGSDRQAVLRLFVRNGVIVAAAGTAVGLGAAAFLSRWMASMLFEVEPTDPLTFGVVAALLLGVAAIACYVPARRAARLDPLQALRAD